MSVGVIISILCVFYAMSFGLIFYLGHVGYKGQKKYYEYKKSKDFVDCNCKLEDNINHEDEVVKYFTDKKVSFKYDNIEEKVKENTSKLIKKEQAETDKNNDDEMSM